MVTIKELKGGTGEIPEEEIETLSELATSCVFGTMMPGKVVIDIRCLKEKLKEKDPDELEDVKRVVDILSENFDDAWRDFDLFHLKAEEY